jgi:hypothetical protein
VTSQLADPNREWSTSSPTFFLAMRTASLLTGLGFSVVYSRSLGPENRSILSLIFISSLAFITASALPVQIYIRNKERKSEIPFLIKSYVRTAFLMSTISTLLVLFALFAFAEIISPLPTTIYIVTSMYSFLSSLTLLLLDPILALRKYRLLGLLDLCPVVIQILVFYLFRHFSQLSTFVCVMLAFITSYFLLFCFLFAYYRRLICLCSDLEYRSKLRIYYRTFWRYSVISAFADRFDKICVAFLLPLENMSKYVVASSILSVFRVLSDEIIRLVTSKHLSWKLNKTRSYSKSWWIMSFSFLSISVASFMVLYDPLIQILLGKVWLLPLSTVAALSIQEFARFYFNYSHLETSSLTEDSVNNLSDRIHQYTAILLLLTLTPLSVILLGAPGAAVAMTIFYVIQGKGRLLN